MAWLQLADLLFVYRLYRYLDTGYTELVYRLYRTGIQCIQTRYTGYTGHPVYSVYRVYRLVYRCQRGVYTDWYTGIQIALWFPPRFKFKCSHQNSNSK